MAFAFEKRFEFFPLVALDFDIKALYRAAHAAELFQLFRQRFQLGFSHAETRNDRHRFTAAPFGVAGDANPSVSRWWGRWATLAPSLWGAATGAQLAVVGREDEIFFVSHRGDLKQG